MLSLLNSSVPVSTVYHPLVQLAEDGAEFSISCGLPVITGGWTVQETELALSWGLTETHLAQAAFRTAHSPPRLEYLSSS